MTEKTKIYKLSVSDIVRLYLGTTLPEQKTLDRGTTEHEQNGYDNKKLYERYYIIDLDNIICIRGIPDKVDPPYVIEFKTTTKKNLEDIVNYAELQLQLYLWLTGLPKGRVDVYIKDLKKFVKGHRYVDYNESLTKTVIVGAYQKLKKFDMS